MILTDKILHDNLERFLAYNKKRTEMVLEVIPKRIRPLYRIIPFLLHINVRSIPGFLDDKDAVFGIYHFDISEEFLADLNTVFPDAAILHNDLHGILPKDKVLPIKSLYLMGSLGTLVQSIESDFDYWVCIFKDTLSPKQLELLHQKCRMIEEWALDRYNLETHFFLTDIKSVRNNNFGTADKESTGTAQAKLLKEEFYRSCILVCGRVPLWWCLPTKVNDTQYEAIRTKIKDSKKVDTEYLIDLGNLFTITREEFFGAAIWQICKAMDSPFKSVLKMALLEVLIEMDKGESLLCNRLKILVHDQKMAIDESKNFDSYALLFDSILDYYKQKNHPNELDLFRKCLYIKSETRCSEAIPKHKVLSAKEKKLRAYIAEWQWNTETISHLDQFKEWEFEEVWALGKSVHNFMIACYQRIAQKLKTVQNSELLISPSDLTVIGQKISSFYKARPFKINFLKRAFDHGLWLESVSVVHSPNKIPAERWSLYQGQLDKADSFDKKLRKQILRSGESLADLFAWALVNKMINKKTSVYLVPNPSPLKMADLQQFVNDFSDVFPPIKVSYIPNQDLLEQERVLRIMAIINLASPRWKEKIDHLTVIFQTSWGETFCQTLTGDLQKEFFKFIVQVKGNDIHTFFKNFHSHIPEGKNTKILQLQLQGWIQALIKQLG